LKTQEQKLAHIRGLARFLDESIPVPGTKYKIGVEPIVGLIPGVGDFFGVTLSAYIILRAADLGVSAATIIRMIINLVIDGVIGSLPFVGDLFDLVWKANKRNIAIVENELLKNAPLKSSKVFVAVAAVALISVMALIFSLFVLVIRGAYEVLVNTFNL
jgi:hypothetical protein